MDAVSRPNEVDASWRLRHLRRPSACLLMIGRLALASSCGLAWGGRLSALAFVPLVFVAWWRSGSRLEAAVVVVDAVLLYVSTLRFRRSRLVTAG